MAFLRFILLLVVTSSVYASPEEMREHEINIMTKCKETTQASQDAVDQFLNLGDLDESHEGKCLVQCGIQAFGAMQEDGTVDNDKAREYFKEAFPDKLEDTASIWEKCQTTEMKVDDHCEFAHSLVKCFIIGIKENNIQRAWK